jgi:hypothetical protein
MGCSARPGTRRSRRADRAPSRRAPQVHGDSVADWEAYYGERKRREDEIAKEFDTQRDAAMDQFYRGDHSWLATLEERSANSRFRIRRSKNCAHGQKPDSPRLKLRYDLPRSFDLPTSGSAAVLSTERALRG